MTTVATSRLRAWVYVLLWIILPPLAIGYQIAAEETARALMGTSFGAVWLLKGATLVSVRWLVALEIASFVAWMVVLDNMKLSQAFPASALSYVFVIAASWLFYHEHAGLLQLAGGAMILTGIWLIGRDEAAS